MIGNCTLCAKKNDNLWLTSELEIKMLSILFKKSTTVLLKYLECNQSTNKNN